MASVIKGVSGIYAVINMMNGKKYIGSTIDLARRKKEHFQYLRQGVNGRHSSLPLKRAVEKYGLESFVFVVLDSNIPVNELIEREQVFMDAFGAEYNMCKTAVVKPVMTPELRKKYSEAGKGRKHSEETKQKIRESAYQRPYPSIETREKLRKGGKKLLGRKRVLSEQGRKNLMAAVKGRVVSDATKDKLRATKKNIMKPINLVDAEGNVIHSYESVKAASRATNIFPCAITLSCRGIRNPKNGMRFVYVR